MRRPKHRPRKKIECAKKSTTPKYQVCQNIDRAKTSTIPKHRPCQNINHIKTWTMPKHRLLQNINRAEVDWPKGPASVLTEQKSTLFINNPVHASSASSN